MSVEKSCIIVVDIQNNTSPKKDLAIKLRLEQQSAAPAPSLEDIQLKLQKAELKRKQTLIKSTNILDKINQVQERKSRREQNALDQKREKLYTKLETAEKLRVQLLTTTVKKAHEVTTKIDRASQLRLEQEKNKE